VPPELNAWTKAVYLYHLSPAAVHAAPLAVVALTTEDDDDTVLGFIEETISKALNKMMASADGSHYPLTALIAALRHVDAHEGAASVPSDGRHGGGGLAGGGGAPATEEEEGAMIGLLEEALSEALNVTMRMTPRPRRPLTAFIAAICDEKTS